MTTYKLKLIKYNGSVKLIYFGLNFWECYWKAILTFFSCRQIRIEIEKEK